PILLKSAPINFEEFVKSQNTDLSVQQQTQLCDVLYKHKDVFNDMPGLCKTGEHSIRVTQGAEIPKRKHYDVPVCYRDEVHNQIENLLKLGIIENSTAKECHPIVCIRKKDGTLRLAVDYRAVNSITHADAYQ